MRDFINYLKNPSEDLKLPAKKIWSVLLVFLTIYIIKIIVAIVSHVVFKDNAPDSGLMDLPTVFPLWLVLFVPPLLEELSFRLWLKRNTATILISSVGFVWCLASMFLADAIYSTDRLVLKCIVALAGGGAVALLLKKQIINAKFPIIFYLSAILFGLMHACNFIDVSSFAGALFVLINLVMHMLTGLFLGYVRVGYGIVASILFHVTNNLVVIFLYL
ncbi:MAG: hypothetical protein CW341_05565 [Bacteroidetes bacterium]|nr:hypothetical protein [Bacteroidota bacterium]